MTQEQKGGFGSHNYQVETIIVSGASYEDMKAIAKDVFEQNMLQFTVDAKKLIQDRGNEIREEILDAFKADASAKPEAFKQPDMQAALFDAQKAYAMSGEATLKSMLIGSIKAASKEPPRSIRAIALQEAIKVLPLLTKDQLRILAISFVVRHTIRHGMTKIQQLNEDYKHKLQGIEVGLSITRGDILHISSTNCGYKEIGELTFPQLLQQGYPQFLNGLTDSAHIEKLVSAAGSTVSKLQELFKTTEIKNLTLTSVGIAVGHTFISDMNKDFIPLSVFL